MDTKSLIPFIAPLVRNLMVVGGGIEAARADNESAQIASALCALAGFAWSLWNAKHKQEIKTELTEVKAELHETKQALGEEPTK